MPSLGDIAGAVAGLGARHIAVEAPRCVKVRHRRAKCTRCLDACPEGALAIERNQLTLQAELCTGCGACAAVCPTQALRTAGPSQQDVLLSVDGLAPQESASAGLRETAVAELEFACEHAHPSSIRNRVVVPALPYVDQGVLVHAAAAGFERIRLTTCNRRECAEPTLASVPGAIHEAQSLLDAWHVRHDIRLRHERERRLEDAPSQHGKPAPRSAQAPATAARQTKGAGKEYSRRGLLTNVMSEAGSIVAETAATQMRGQLGMQAPKPTLAQALTDGAGNMRTFAIPRAETLVDDLFRLDPEPEGLIEARSFARVEVNSLACSRCAMCAKFCPTGALQGKMAPIGGSPFDSVRLDSASGSLSFRACDCVACGLCQEICPLNCLSMHHDLDAAALFELEPEDLLA